tara:strand:- start:3563 stop:4543 length:981 start_codon:yes stop_codon:yes gene_type:complete
MAVNTIGNKAVDSTLITGNTTVTAASDDTILISDTSDSGNLKKALISTITDTIIANPGNNRVLTDTDTGGSINAEANLTFDGTTLVVANNIKIADGANIGSASDADAIAIAADGDVTLTQDLIVGGNLTINGTTTTVNSTTTTVDDPIFTIGGDSAPGSDDNKDRGIEFRWHNGSAAKVGFFGFDDSTGKFTFVPDATNSSEVFSGTKGDIDVNDISANAGTFGDSVGVTGNVTASNAFVIGSASMNETDLEKLDDITNGTAAANKALVLGASKEISTITTATITNLTTTTLTGGAITSSNFAGVTTLLIKNSSGTTLKTIRSPST